MALVELTGFGSAQIPNLDRISTCVIDIPRISQLFLSISTRHVHLTTRGSPGRPLVQRMRYLAATHCVFVHS